MGNLFDILLGRSQSCKQRLDAAERLANRSYEKLMTILDHEPYNYTPVHNHGVSLIKVSDRKR